MIISRTPFRLSFAGGGTDLLQFHCEEEGAVLSTALNKYMYITVNKRFDETLRLSYSKTEIHSSVRNIEHPILKYILSKYKPDGGLEIISMADIPSGTGLGSSSSFTVGVLNALKKYLKLQPSPEQLAREACDIEINRLGEPIGKQDQYIAAYGGLQFIRFQPKGQVLVEPVNCSANTKVKLKSSCLLFFTGLTRDSKSVLKEQSEKTNMKRDVLREMAAIAKKMKLVLERDDNLDLFGNLLHEAWVLKKSMASNISNPRIDEWYDRAKRAGALGGKILGAGSGGFLMLFCEPSKQVAVTQELKELKPFQVEFENQGSQIIFEG